MAKKKTKPCVYIGPSLPGLTQNTVFAKFPPHVAEMVKNNENLAGLMVPVDKLQEARRGVITPGNILHRYAQNLRKREE